VLAFDPTYDRPMNARLLSLLPCLGLASACVNTVNIDAEDKTRFSSLAASLPIQGQDNLRLRVKATRVDGSFDQRLDVDKLIRIDNSSFTGPDEVSGELDLTYYSVALGGANRATNQFRTETYIGIAQTRFDLNLDNGSSQLRLDDNTVELYLQYAIYAPISESLDFGFSWAVSLGRESSGISEIDLLLEFDAAEHLQITGGYRWFDYQYGTDAEDSNLEVDFEGPFLGIRIPF